MPVYPGRRPGTYRIVVWSNGTPHEATFEGLRADALKEEARMRIRFASDAGKLKAAATFSGLCKEYALHAEQHLKDSTWRQSRIYQVATLVEHLGPTRIDRLSVQQIDEYKLARRKAGVTVATVNNELRALGAIRTYALAAGYPFSAAKWRRLPVRGKPRVRVYSVEQIAALFEAARAKEPALLPVLIFMVNTGCRKGEAIAARWDWIDFDAGLVRIPSTAEWQPKNGLPREVPMADAVRAILSGAQKHRSVVFPNALGKAFKRFPKEAWWAARDAAGLEGGPHTLRHTFASHFLAATRDMKLLAEVMGHSHTRVTELYAHLLPGALDRARNAVNLLPETMALTMAKAAGGTRKQR